MTNIVEMPIRRRARRQPRVLLVLDAQNLCHPTIRLDYARLREFCQAMGELIASVAFVTDSPETLNFQLMLHRTGYEVRPVRLVQNGNGQAKGNADIGIAFWLGRALEQYRLKPGDIVVLGTGDADFIPIVEALRERDIQVTLIGYRSCTAPRLQIAANTFHAIEETPLLHRKEAAHAA